MRCRAIGPCPVYGKEGVIHSVAIVARLKNGAEAKAAELLAKGPPFDPYEHRLECHIAYLSAGEVVFVFEGPEVDVILDDMVENPFEPWSTRLSTDGVRSSRVTPGSHVPPTPGSEKRGEI